MSRTGRTVFAGAGPASPPAAVRPAVAMAVPPAVWFLHLNVSYVLVPPACSLGSRWPFAVVTAIAIAALVPGALVSRRAWRDGEGGLVRFLGWFGLVFAALFAGATLLLAGSVLVIDPCL